MTETGKMEDGDGGREGQWDEGRKAIERGKVKEIFGVCDGSRGKRKAKKECMRESVFHLHI